MSTVNVTEYGATGDGTTDDTAAIQAAIDDASSGDTVYLPGSHNDGHYRVMANGGGAIKLDGSSLASDLTIKGDLGDSPHADGNTLIELGDVPDDKFQQVFRIVGSDVLDFTLRELEISGNSSVNTSSSSARPGVGIAEFDGGTTTGHNHTYERLYIFECAGSGLNGRLGDVTIRNCTAIDCDTHGFGLRGYGNGTVVRNVRAENNGASGLWGTGIDLGEGDFSVDGTFCANNLAGCKFNSRTDNVVWKNATFEGGPLTDNTVFRFNEGNTKVVSAVELDNVAIRNADEIGLRIDGISGDTWHIGSLETTNCAQGADDKGILGRGDADVAADELIVLDNGGRGVSWAADGEMAISTLYHDGNDGEPAGGWKDENLSVDTMVNERIHLDTPARDDVGVWSASISEPESSTSVALSTQGAALQATGGTLPTASD